METSVQSCINFSYLFRNPNGECAARNYAGTEFPLIELERIGFTVKYDGLKDRMHAIVVNKH